MEDYVRIGMIERHDSDEEDAGCNTFDVNDEDDDNIDNLMCGICESQPDQMFDVGCRCVENWEDCDGEPLDMIDDFGDDDGDFQELVHTKRRITTDPARGSTRPATSAGS